MTRQGIMLCYPFEEKRLNKWNPPYIVQPKLDGVRCRYVPYEGASFLLSSEENIIFGVPHIKDYLDKHCPYIELDGELYTHGVSFEEIVSITSREVTIRHDYDKIEFHVFDVVTPEPQYKRLQRLLNIRSLLEDKAPIKVVDYYLAQDLDEIMRCYDEILSKGYEGIVVREFNSAYIRQRSPMLMKFKPKKSDTYRIIGFREEISIKGESKNSLGALVCAGDDGTTFSVGTGFTRDQRLQLWETRDRLVGKTAEISYQHITHSGGVPRFPVFVKVLS